MLSWLLFKLQFDFRDNVIRQIIKAIQMKRRGKDDDTFSFKAQSQQSEEGPLTQKSTEKQENCIPPRSTPWTSMAYRFEENGGTTAPVHHADRINETIRKLDEQLSGNIKRRIELENKLNTEKQQDAQKRNQQYLRSTGVKSDGEVADKFKAIQIKAAEIEAKLQDHTQNPSHAFIPSLMRSGASNLKAPSANFKSTNSKNKKRAPDQIYLQKLLKVITFPELPLECLAKLEQQAYALYVTSQHSDILYMLMAINFHMGNYLNVRKYYTEIVNYRVYEAKSVWIAAEAEYELGNHELCIKFTNRCQKQLSDRYLPRFLHLQAMCYEQMGNLVNSVVCYSQLLKIKPKACEYYLQRGMIYDKIGYSKEARQDFIHFGTLNPDAKKYLKEKILAEANPIKRKQMIKVLAKVT